MKCYHLTWSSQGRNTLFTTEELRRKAARTVARVVGRWVVLFCIVDDHLHIVLLCPESSVRTLGRNLHFALQALTEVALDPVHVRPIHTRAHLERVVDSYILVQPTRHGLTGHAALWSGSCFGDLVGARVLPGLELRLWDAMPRYRLRQAHQALGLPDRQLMPAGVEQLRAAGASRLVAAAASACCAGPDLSGNLPEVVTARLVAARLTLEAGIPSTELAAALAITRNGAAKLRRRSPPGPETQAARARVALEDLVSNLGPR